MWKALFLNSIYWHYKHSFWNGAYRVLETNSSSVNRMRRHVSPRQKGGAFRTQHCPQLQQVQYNQHCRRKKNAYEISGNSSKWGVIVITWLSWSSTIPFTQCFPTLAPTDPLSHGQYRLRCGDYVVLFCSKMGIDIISLLSWRLEWGQIILSDSMIGKLYANCNLLMVTKSDA